MQKQTKYNEYISLIIFISCLVLVGLVIISTIFPSFLVITSAGYENFAGIDQFQIGHNAMGFLIINIIILIAALLYSKKRFLPKFGRSIDKIFNFDTSNKIFYISLVSILGIYVILTSHEIFEPELWKDYELIEPRLETWSINNVKGVNGIVNDFFITLSMSVFKSYKVIPFLASTLLVIVTGLITIKISNKKVAGLIAISFLLSSGIFRIYDTSIVYPNFWVLFYFLAIYAILRLPMITVIPFIVGLLSKPMIILFLPIQIFFIFQSKASLKIKMIISSTFVIIIIVGIIVGGFTEFFDVEKINPHDFLQALNSIPYQLRYDVIILASLLPVVIGLFIISKKIPYAKSIQILIIGTILAQPIIVLFSEIMSEPYRFMPFVVAISIGVGVLFSKIPKTQDKLQSKKL